MTAEFSASLLQSPVSNMLIWCSRNISYYCWKQLHSLKRLQLFC